LEAKIRTANFNDVERISTIHVNAWKKAYIDVMPREYLNSLTAEDRMPMWEKALLSPGKGIYIVSEFKGEVQGFAVFGPARDGDISNLFAGELVALNVNPIAWSSGIGSALLKHVINCSNGKKWKFLYLWVVESNVRAISLYEKFGFENEGKVKVDKSHSGTPITELRYIKKLC
jgi:GNAT superfamily N-acetyltransferase